MKTFFAVDYSIILMGYARFLTVQSLKEISSRSGLSQPACIHYSGLFYYWKCITAKAALKFGSEAWVLKREEQRLEAAQMKFLRHLE
jgi:hypothetical protein